VQQFELLARGVCIPSFQRTAPYVFPYLGKIRAQVTHDQLSGAEVAQRVAVPQRQLEEAWVLRLCGVQCSPCCGAEPAPALLEQSSNSSHGTIIGLTDNRQQQAHQQPSLQPRHWAHSHARRSPHT
jgi:hypothetical protein